MYPWTSKINGIEWDVIRRYIIININPMRLFQGFWSFSRVLKFFLVEKIEFISGKTPIETYKNMTGNAQGREKMNKQGREKMNSSSLYKQRTEQNWMPIQCINPTV